jgi:hypothetical protein
MRRAFTAFAAALLFSATASAHALWLEPDEGGVRLFFGEFDENLREASPGLLDRLSPPTAKAAAVDGKAFTVEKTATSFKLTGDTGKDGVVAEQARVNERKQGDKVTRTYGFLGARYVPDLKERAPVLVLDVVPAAKPGSFKVFYDGKPLAKAKLELIAESGWKKEFKSEADGTVEMATPWRGAYVIEVEHLDATPGSHNGAAYDGKRFVTTLFFRVADGMQGPPQPPVHTPKREMAR